MIAKIRNRFHFNRYKLYLIFFFFFCNEIIFQFDLIQILIFFHYYAILIKKRRQCHSRINNF